MLDAIYDKIDDAQPQLKTFVNMKYAGALNLNNLETKARRGVNGKSTGIFGGVWFCAPKGDSLFKVFFMRDSVFDKDGEVSRPQNLLMINELLCSALARQAGVPCAQYDIAYYGQHQPGRDERGRSGAAFDGVVTYNLLKAGERTVDFMSYGFDRFCQSIDEEKQNYPQTKIDENIKKNVFKAIVFQLLTLQTDGKTDSYVFAEDSEAQTLRFAGLCDNEYAFNVSTYQRQGDEHGDIYGLFGEGFEPLDVIEAYNSRISLRCIHLKQENLPHFDFFTRINEVAEFVKNNREYLQPLREILDGLDGEKAFQTVQEENGVSADHSYKKYVCEILKFGCRELESAVGLKKEEEC